MDKLKQRVSVEGIIHDSIRVLDAFTNPKFIQEDKMIPIKILKNAKAIAFITQVKGGFLLSGTLGTGIVLKRNEDGSWSGPMCIGTGGIGWGAQIGGQKTDSVLVINGDGLKAFCGKAHLKFGADIALSAGPVGRHASADVRAGEQGVGACYSYSHSQGLYAGISLEGAGVFPRDKDNEQFYGRKATPNEIFEGEVTTPINTDLKKLHKKLEEIIKLADSQSSEGQTPNPAPQAQHTQEEEDLPSPVVPPPGAAPSTS